MRDLRIMAIRVKQRRLTRGRQSNAISCLLASAQVNLRPSHINDKKNSFREQVQRILLNENEITCKTVLIAQTFCIVFLFFLLR